MHLVIKVSLTVRLNIYWYGLTKTVLILFQADLRYTRRSYSNSQCSPVIILCVSRRTKYIRQNGNGQRSSFTAVLQRYNCNYELYIRQYICCYRRDNARNGYIAVKCAVVVHSFTVWIAAPKYRDSDLRSEIYAVQLLVNYIMYTINRSFKVPLRFCTDSDLCSTFLVSISAVLREPLFPSIAALLCDVRFMQYICS